PPPRRRSRRTGLRRDTPDRCVTISVLNRSRSGERVRRQRRFSAVPALAATVPGAGRSEGGSMADPDPVVEGVFTSFVKDQQWKLADIPDNAEDRHAASFIRRRATTLLAENPSLRTDLAKLNARLTDEV